MPSTRLNLRLLPLFCLSIASVSALPSKRCARVDFTSLGCFTDNDANHRALTSLHTDGDSMTVVRCAIFCSRYEFFGIEYGRECYCGSSLNSTSTKVDDSECSLPCAGKPKGSERCGADSRINIYSNNKPNLRKPASLPGVTSLGCFVDGGNRVLPSRIISTPDMTAAKCAENCAGYEYFGTEWSSECFCGTVAPTVSAPAADCSMACSGNDDELCGGSLRLNVYKFDSVASTSTTALASTAEASQSTSIAENASETLSISSTSEVVSTTLSTSPAEITAAPESTTTAESTTSNEASTTAV